VVEKKGKSCRGNVVSGVDTEILIAFYVANNTSQSKGWIIDSDSTIHVCSQKELFNNSLVAIDEGVVIMVDGSAYEIIGTRTVKVTKRNVMVHALEEV